MIDLGVPTLVLLALFGLVCGIGITALGPGGVLATIALFAFTDLSPAQVAGTAIVTNLATFARRTDLIDKSVIRVFQTLRENKDLPVLEDIVGDELKPVLRMINAPSSTGMPFIAPPEVPAERLALCVKHSSTWRAIRPSSRTPTGSASPRKRRSTVPGCMASMRS